MKKFLLTIIIIGLFFYLIVEMSRGVNCFMEYCYANRSIDIKKEDFQWISDNEYKPFHADRIFARNLPIIRIKLDGINASIKPSWLSSYFGGQNMDYRSINIDTNLASKDKELIIKVSRTMNKNRLFLVEKQIDGSVLIGIKRKKTKLFLLAPRKEESNGFYIMSYPDPLN